MTTEEEATSKMAGLALDDGGASSAGETATFALS